MLRKAGWLGAAVVVAAGVFVAAGWVHAAPRGWPTRKSGDMWIVDTPHYQFETDHEPKAAQLIASHQEALFLELYRRMGKTKPETAIKRMQVRVFTTERQYKQAMGENAEGSQGLYTGSVIGGYAPPDDLERLLETLRHEGTHQFVRQFIGDKCPVWLNEGLAVFFQYAQFEKGVLKIGQVPLMTLNILKKAMDEGKLISMSEMLSMSYDGWSAAVRAKTPRANIQYPQAWSIVHFLEAGDGGKYRTPLLQYIYFLSRGQASDRAWAKAFGTNTPAFEKRWKAYLKELKSTGGINCRMKLRMLGSWALKAQKRPEILKDMETFRTVAVTGILGGFTITLGGVETELKDAESIRDLFRCPDDKSKGDAPSYEIVPDPAGGPSRIRCTRHLGYVLETGYEKDEEGKWSVKVISRPVLPGEKKDGAAKTPPAGAAKPGD